MKYFLSVQVVVEVIKFEFFQIIIISPFMEKEKKKLGRDNSQTAVMEDAKKTHKNY